MSILFYKYHGAGNDFIIIDNRKDDFKVQKNLIEKMCNRRFGIGADGLMLLEESDEADFFMRYFNSDGRESTMCGNGGRCITAFAKSLGLIKFETRFIAHDGPHLSKVIDEHTISLQMGEVDKFQHYGEDYIINTGSPHYIKFVDNLVKAPVYTEGKKIREDKNISREGVNVNFVYVNDDQHISIRTYERGVENETLACGTGSVASAICSYLSGKTDKTSLIVYAVGGKLKVDFKPMNDKYFTDVWLTGPVEFVFEGRIQV